LLPAANSPIMIDSAQIAWAFVICHLYSLPRAFSRVRFEDKRICELSFCAVPRLPSSNHSCDVQIQPVCFAPGLTHLSVPPYKDRTNW
jgi:hypothetical protein